MPLCFFICPDTTFLQFSLIVMFKKHTILLENHSDYGGLGSLRKPVSHLQIYGNQNSGHVAPPRLPFVWVFRPRKVSMKEPLAGLCTRRHPTVKPYKEVCPWNYPLLYPRPLRRYRLRLSTEHPVCPGRPLRPLAARPVYHGRGGTKRLLSAQSRIRLDVYRRRGVQVPPVPPASGICAGEGIPLDAAHRDPFPRAIYPRGLQ